MGRDFIINYIAWRHITGLFLGGGICIFFGIYYPYDNRYTPLIIILGVVLLITGIWVTINFLKRDEY